MAVQTLLSKKYSFYRSYHLWELRLQLSIYYVSIVSIETLLCDLEIYIVLTVVR